MKLWTLKRKKLWKCREPDLRFLTSFFSFFKTPSIHELKKASIPNHIAIIMDGNGRWAQKKGLPRIFGHKKGAEILKEIVIASKDLGIKYITAYTFSSENWARPQDEVNELMKLFFEVLERELDLLVENNVRLNLIGDRKLIPQEVLEVFENAERKTKDNKELVLNIALSYGSRLEIFEAVKKIIQLQAAKKINIEDLDFNSISKYLYTSEIPDPDLLIRTGGECRISNFLLWQIAYTELYFTRILWPDFNRKYFFKAVYDYQKRSRRFGKL